MLDKLVGIEERYEELNQQLMAVGDDYEKAAELGKERADLEPIVEKIRAYRRALQQLEETRAMQESEEDEGMRELVLAEQTRLEEEIQGLERTIKTMLLPKDKRDERNVIMEIPVSYTHLTLPTIYSV